MLQFPRYVDSVIIGVDETGDFSDGSRTWFVSAFIQPSAMPAVEAALRQWERGTRRRLGLTDEIKGARVDAIAAEAFVVDIIGAADRQAVRWRAFAVDFDDMSRIAMALQRERFAGGYERWADVEATSDDPQRQRFGSVLRQWADWIRRRDDRQMLKLATLAVILPELVELAFGLSIAGGHDEELVELSIRIDRGYIKTSELDIWRDILRNVFIEGTRKRPIPFSEEWPADHPVPQTFVEHGSGTTFVMRPSFKERINFYDSANTPAVRVADVLAAVLRRGLDGGPLVPALRLLQSSYLVAYPYTMLEWTHVVPVPRPNPYLSIRNDEKGT